ncbi:MAG: PEP-CTERM sorting domain-containing protein [bacterium]
MGAILAGGLLLSSLSQAGPFDDPGHEILAMAAWATSVEAFEPGPMDIAAPELGVASFGLPEAALGPATADGFDVVSLGDGGFITLAFEEGIGNGTGDDLAVFENGFYSLGALFAELAFVEVSSNGVDFARFEATSLHQTPIGEGGTLDPSDVDNLAGDQPLGIGTGFDLQELAAHPLVLAGLLDPTAIYFVRLVDVIGDGSTVDGAGAPVYDPYPTAFSSGGFDLEAVGVLHPAPEPSTTLLLMIGAGALLGPARRRLSGRRSP